MKISFALVAAIASIAVAGCGGDDSEGSGLDVSAGSYKGVGIGSSLSDVESEFGEAEPLGNNPVTPTGKPLDEIHMAPVFTCGSDQASANSRYPVLRYELASYFLIDDEVCGLLVIDDAVETEEGVGIGDELDAASDAHEQLECEDTRPIAGGPEFRSCTGEVADGIYAWFGGDPIDTIQFSTESLGPTQSQPDVTVVE